MTDPELLALAATLSHQAADTIMLIRGRGFSTLTKADDSPVTEADHAAETLILRGAAGRRRHSGDRRGGGGGRAVGAA